MESKHDEVVRNVTPCNTGRKWRLYDQREVPVFKGLCVDTGVMRRCQLRIEAEKIVGNIAQGRMGLEFAGGCDGCRKEALS